MDIATPGVATPPTVDDLNIRTRCAACDSPDLDQLLSLGEHPPTNVYPATAAESLSLPRWPLDLLICRRCTLAQTWVVPPGDLLFGQGYGFRTGHASARHMRELADWVTDLADWVTEVAAPGFVVDVGCNDGTLLAAFRDLGCWQTLGVDPAADATNDAHARGIDAITARLTPAVAEDILAERGHPDVVTATNVLAHVDDLHEILAGIAVLLGRDGRLVAEMQYAPDMLLSNAYDTIYHEHRYIWSLYALERAFDRHGLGILDAVPIPQHGGSVRVVAAAAGHPHPRVEDLVDAERRYGPAGWAAGTAARALRFETQLRELARTAPQPLAAVGASAKLVTLANWLRWHDRPIRWVTDTTPAKQGRYVPGTAIPIVGPDRQPEDAATVLLGAWSYLPNMLRREAGMFDAAGHIAAGGRLLLPVPVPTLI